MNHFTNIRSFKVEHDRFICTRRGTFGRWGSWWGRSGVLFLGYHYCSLYQPNDSSGNQRSQPLPHHVSVPLATLVPLLVIILFLIIAVLACCVGILSLSRGFLTRSSA